MNNKEYFLGLDIGTGSVGWAVTDTEYNLIKINRKNAWGSVLFDTSEGAEKRRTSRCSRRRYRRQKERLALLRELFEEEIQKVDAGFFIRLDESRYIPEDKRDIKGNTPILPYNLFVDENYTDKNYHVEFPTIYHLRKALIKEDREFDVRLVYLAIAHILKNRGHFLANVSTTENSRDFKTMFNEFVECWNRTVEKEDDKFCISTDKVDEIEKILKEQDTKKTDKKRKLIETLDIVSKIQKEIISLIVGVKVPLAKIFDNEEYKLLELDKICFEDTAYEENEQYYEENLQDDFAIIEKARLIHDWIVLSNILNGNPDMTLSEAKVQCYEKHRKDLKILKDSFKNGNIIGTEEEKRNLYKKVFGVPEKDENNYSTYIGMVMKVGKKVVIDNKKCNRSDFYKYVEKNVLKNMREGEVKDYIKREMELDNFMPKLRVKENAVLPYQLNEKELRKILNNAEKYLSFLKEKDSSGKSVSDKIMLLLNFRIPYYVGPLNENSERAWLVREKGRITPWNFEEKVNIEESAKNFIEKMTSKCTYLKKENVLPKNSLIYEKYMVLNEINNLTIKSEPISVELKQRIYKNVFEKKSKVTIKKIVDYLKSEEGYNNITRDDIGGIDIEIKSSLKSYHAFKRDFTNSELSIKDKEDIIKDMTLFGAEPKLLKSRLVKKYPDYEKQIGALIRNHKCKDWGRLSNKLLCGIATDVPGQGEVGTVMYQLWNTNKNLSKILLESNSPYAEMIERENYTESKDKISYEMVDELYVSPATRRQIWKALQVTEEIVHAMGHMPKRIFVEMAREHTESKRSVTRKDELKELYKSLKNEKELYKELENSQNDELRRDKLYLYFKQMGICAYTGKRIEIDDLCIDNLYDIDHIYPQSKTADDSMDNKVLVYKPANADKGDDYPINPDIQKTMRETWDMWYSKKLISKEKYKRLTRTTPLSDDELLGFINRQLVETNQSTKAFTDLLKQIMPEETEIVYSKAKNVSRFRQQNLSYFDRETGEKVYQYEFLKIRELNDHHHAKDAYLNIVVGNVYHLKFTKDVKKYFINNGTYRTYNLEKMFEKDVKLGNEIAWVKGSNGTINTVKRVLNNNKVLVTKQTYEETGELFDIQQLKKGKGQVPLKSGIGNERLSDISKYGGYNKAKIAYFILVNCKKKGKIAKYMLPVPCYLSKKMQADEKYMKEYFEHEYNIEDIEVVKDKILLHTLMIYEGFKVRIAGKFNDRIILHNANQLCLDNYYNKIIKEVSKYIRDLQDKKDVTINENSGITDDSLMEMYEELQNKLKNTIYSSSLIRAYSKKIENQKEDFKTLSLEKKVQYVYEILKLFQCTPEMPFSSGAINMGMNITDKKNLAIIHQSVTGIYEKIERINE